MSDGRVRPVWPSTRGGGLWNKRYQKRYEKLKIWWLCLDYRVPVPVPQHVRVPDPVPVPVPNPDPAPRPFWTETDDEGFDAGAIAG